MKKSTKCFLFCTTAAVAGMYAYNKFVANTATRQNLLNDKNGQYYSWTHGDIYYTKEGNGTPILFIHDASPESSSYEWSRIVKRIAKDHTVYSIDLLGCGRSDKPAIEYTSFLYVQLITAFIQNVIQEKTSVVASAMSTSFVIMANQMDEELFDEIILVNPIAINQLKMIPDNLSKTKKTLLSLPLLGTFIYNIMNNPIHIDRRFRDKYFSKSHLISTKMEDTYYESAHLYESNGKYLYSSLIGNYVNIDITRAIKNIDKPVKLIGSRDIKNNLQNLEKYRKLNKNFEITMISNCKAYPQLEVPEKLASILKKLL